MNKFVHRFLITISLFFSFNFFIANSYGADNCKELNLLDAQGVWRYYTQYNAYLIEHTTTWNGEFRIFRCPNAEQTNENIQSLENELKDQYNLIFTRDIMASFWALNDSGKNMDPDNTEYLEFLTKVSLWLKNKGLGKVMGGVFESRPLFVSVIRKNHTHYSDSSKEVLAIGNILYVKTDHFNKFKKYLENMYSFEGSPNSNKIKNERMATIRAIKAQLDVIFSLGTHFLESNDFFIGEITPGISESELEQIIIVSNYKQLLKGLMDLKYELENGQKLGTPNFFLTDGGFNGTISRFVSRFVPIVGREFPDWWCFVSRLNFFNRVAVEREIDRFRR